MTSKLELFAVPDIPLVEPGDDLAELIPTAMEKADIRPQQGDCLVVAQKIVSKSEDCYGYLNTIEPTQDTLHLAEQVKKDPRLVQLILDESVDVLRHRPGALIVEHRLGYVHANAGIDQSNISNDPENPRVLLLPENPDRSATTLQTALQDRYEIELAVVISDSAGRAWRNGITGYAIGTAGFVPVQDQTGQTDLFGRRLEVTQIAVADELAAAASILMGQADEASPVVLIRGAKLQRSSDGSQSLIRARSEDLFR